MADTTHPTCTECGGPAPQHYGGDIGVRIRHNRQCFTCAFWSEKVEWAKAGDITEDGGTCVRVGDQHYVFHPVTEKPRGFRGFGGAHVTATLHDGRAVESNNAWHQGTIPDRFRDRLPANADRLVWS